MTEKNKLQINQYIIKTKNVEQLGDAIKKYMKFFEQQGKLSNIIPTFLNFDLKEFPDPITPVDLDFYNFIKSEAPYRLAMAKKDLDKAIQEIKFIVAQIEEGNQSMLERHQYFKEKGINAKNTGRYEEYKKLGFYKHENN